ncbi:carbohydrate porin [Thaumasiovibrio subtropicus]|uniref:carbohydrate porin n=1 Tax=Thaumasiovibrio subtropicus TaxID=1891207 RepID=UPI000B34DE3B|nr:carbohydrate porin [Thaumasiovibrio subtropicus]
MSKIKYTAPLLLACALPAMAADWQSRGSLTDGALTLNGEYTHYLQSVTSGSDDSSAKNAHRLDAFISASTEKMGLWEGGSFHSQVVYRKNDANDLGFTTATHTNAAFYGDKFDSPFVSSFFYTHGFDNGSRLILGKIDAIELISRAPFYGGAARYGFNNLNFVAPPSGVTPPSFAGAVYSFKTDHLNWTAMLYDPRDRYEANLNFKELFKDGVNASIGATYPTQLFGRNTSIGLNATYSTEEGTDWLSIASDELKTNAGKYNIRAQFTHNFVEQGHNAWGLFLRGSVADGNPNLLSGSFAGGVGGDALFFNRPQDKWGLGYFYANIANDMQTRAEELGLDVKDEHGFEAFYAYQALPWLTFTADVQYRNIQTLTAEKETNATIVGLRTNIKL